MPPSGLPNWDAGSTAGISDGVVIQYQVFGSNNPNPLSVGGTTYAVKGRTPVHEVGHYLGLRHIWGDANNCTGEDGINDTPKANDASAQDCDTTKNTCVDAIAGIDMPDMIENYMDYSAEDCQNSFTMEQLQFMRWVIRLHRTDIATVSFTGIQENNTFETIITSPNPAHDVVNIYLKNADKNSRVSLYNASGIAILNQIMTSDNLKINTINFAPGIYFIELISGARVSRSKLMIVH